MKRLFLVVLLLALAGTAGATDIKGKWGLGVGMGSTMWGLSGSEASLIRGKTERTAWILDLDINESYQDFRSDTSGRIINVDRDLAVSNGPRIRRYTRPQAMLSPYWDSYFHLNGQNSGNSSSNYYQSVGATAGLDFGVEYFTPWHFALAAHTGFFSASLNRLWDNNNYNNGKSKGWRQSARVGFSPRLQLRVYF